MAGPLCKVCAHDERIVIDVKLARWTPLPKLSQDYGLSMSSLCRHRKNHMPPGLKASLIGLRHSSEEELRRLCESENERLLEQLSAITGRIMAGILDAEQNGDSRAASSLYSRYLEAWEKKARLLGQLGVAPSHVTQNIVMLPEWSRFAGELHSVLAPFPEAQQAVASFFLRKVEAARPFPPMLEARAA